MKIITLEEHFHDEKIFNANLAFQPPLTGTEKEQAEFFKLATEKLSMKMPELFNIEKYRLPFMDKNKITMQVLSMT